MPQNYGFNQHCLALVQSLGKINIHRYQDIFYSEKIRNPKHAAEKLSTNDVLIK